MHEFLKTVNNWLDEKVWEKVIVYLKKGVQK